MRGMRLMGHKLGQNQEVLISMGSKSKGTLDSLVKGEEEHEINHEMEVVKT